MVQHALMARPDQHPRLTLDLLARHSGMHPALVLRFVECGLLQPIEEQGAVLLFYTSDILRLAVINRLRNDLSINVPGVTVVLQLLDKIRELERENKSLRYHA
jgi:DNA-binding transcriptional MerR regulator